MEVSVQKSDSADIPKKSRSVDLKSVYVNNSGGGYGKSSVQKASKGLNREKPLPCEISRSDTEDSGRKRSRKEAPLSSFEPVVIKRRKNSLNSSRLKPDGFSSGVGKPEKQRSTSSRSDSLQNLSSDRVLDSVNNKHDHILSTGNSGSLNGLGDTVVIPKKPRGILRQRKLDQADSSKTVKDDFGCNIDSCAEAKIIESSLDAAAFSLAASGKRKKKSSDVNENGSSRDSPISIKGEKSVRRRKKNLRTSSKAHMLENKTSLTDDGKKFFEDFLDDELEQNAARMLSSRFDPSCTGFLGSGASSLSNTADGVHENLKASQPESSTADADGRMLRPRKHNGKSLVRKRRHFYEVNSRDVDPYCILKQRIRVFWPLDKSWYFGLVKDYDPVTRLHHVKYDDRDEEWIDLQNERFKLLLFPSEISGKLNAGKTWRERKQNGKGSEKKALDGSCMDNCVESEPIIAWLTRSKHRRKLSLTNMMKKQRTHLLRESQSSMLLESKGQFSSLFSKSEVTLPDASEFKSSDSMNDRELSFVYFRKKFNKRRESLNNIREHESVEENLVGSINILASIADSAGALGELDVFGSLVELKQVKLKISLQHLCIHDFALGVDFSLWHSLYCLQFGKLMNRWPTVYMEIIIVDDMLGLRLLSFEGSVKCAAMLLCLIITSFSQSSKSRKLREMRMPFTSVGIKLSGLHAQGGKLLFLLHRFLEMERSNWRNVEDKLKHQCVTIAEIPVVDFTPFNFENILKGSSEMHCASVFRCALSLENFPKWSFSDVMRQMLPDKVLHLDMNPTVGYCDERSRDFPSATSPSVVLSLHIKSLIESNAASVSFQKNNSSSVQEYPDSHGKLTTNDCSPSEDPSDQVSDITTENLGPSSGQLAANSVKRAVGHLKVDTDALSISNDGDWTESSDRSRRNEEKVTGNSIDHGDMEMNGCDATVVPAEGFPSHTGSSQDAERSCSSFPDGYSSPEKSEGGYNSYLNNSNVHSRSFDQVEEQSIDKETLAAQSSLGLAWEMNEFSVRCLSRPASGSVEHSNVNSSISPTFGQYSKLWPEDFMPNRFNGGSKKPRTQVSYSLPFGGYDLGSKRRSHNRKPRCYKKGKTDNGKRMLGASVNFRSYYESLTCNANVLVTAGDKGWRECDAQVGLQSDDQKEWRICVKFLGVTKYVYKAQHILQPGITNRHTHAMMWKVGKDWALEFTDRSQWSLFKEIHEECYNRNIRASCVRNIPIPGVRLIADDDDDDHDDVVGVPFVRSSSKYYRQDGTEVDMALDPAHVLYDMDSDDEKWVSEVRTSVNIDGGKGSEVTDDIFERVMDIFEKFAYAQQCDDFSSDEIEEFMVDVGPIDVVKTIYEYWRQKRLGKGLPLIRQFQPALWVQYQQQLKEWESAMSRMQNLPDGGRGKACPLKKPNMFAFCLKPRGLDNGSKGMKQRSHKKFMSTGSHGSVFVREQDGFHHSGRRVGEDRAMVSLPSYDSSDSYHSNDGLERYQHPKLYRSNSKKRGGTLSSPRDFQTTPFSCNKRLKKYGSFDSVSMNRQILHDGLRRHNRADIDELKLRDASNAAQHAANMARMKREKAQWLHHKADLAIHRATVALMIAEAMHESKEDLINSDED